MSRWFARLDDIRATPDIVQNVHNVQKGVAIRRFEQSEHYEQQISSEEQAHDERCRIIEANGISSIWAEAFAKLDAGPRPISTTPERWLQLLNDAGHFLDKWGRQAAALEWNPVVCFDQIRGFVPLIEGGTVTAITGSSAAIHRTTTSQRQYLMCRLDRIPGDTAPLWRVWSAECIPTKG